MSTDTGTSTAAVICLTRVTTSSYVIPSWSALPTESASGWLPTVSAANPASTANPADQASQTVGRTTGFPGWCKANMASARFSRTWSDIGQTSASDVICLTTYCMMWLALGVVL